MPTVYKSLRWRRRWRRCREVLAAAAVALALVALAATLLFLLID